MANRSKPHLHKSGQWRTRIAGKEYWLGTDQQAAYRRFAQLIGRAKPAVQGRPVIVAEVVERFRQRCDAWTARQLDDFIRWIGSETVANPPANLDGYIVALKRKGNAVRTIRHKAHAARAALLWGVRQKWIAFAPDPPKLRKPPRVARDVPLPQLAAALATIPARARAILTFITETGCRPSEACGLKWSMRRGDTFVLPQHKETHKGKSRTIYLTAAAKVIVDAQPTGAAFVFMSRLGKPYTPTGLHSILRRRGITGAYALRHTFAQAASETVPMDVLAKLMGHADAATTARHYYEVRSARALAGAKALSAVVPPDMPVASLPAVVVQDDRRGAKPKRRRDNTSDGTDAHRPASASAPAPNAGCRTVHTA